MTNRCPGGPHEPEHDVDQDVNKLQDKVFL